MKKIFCLLLVLFAFNKSYSQNDMFKGIKAQGKEFYFVFPPNEIHNPKLTKIDLHIYVTSEKNTNVHLEYQNYSITKPVTAYEITIFSASTNDLFWEMEIDDFETISDKAIRLFADEPISVFIINSKHQTSEGFLVLPTESWGYNYIHTAYYDFVQESEYKRGGGFTIISKEDSTNIDIVLKGIDRNNGMTTKGHKIGDTITVNLNRGDVYSIVGDGKTAGFDLTGSRIKSSKPIGFISFHIRTKIPTNFPRNGRDHLCEMLPPIRSWGKIFTALDFNGDGDYFRIVAGYPDTKWNLKWYDKRTNVQLGELSGKLDKDGDFYEYDPAPEDIPIKGISHWEADKPVMLMQYAYSDQWSDSGNYDPFMVMVMPEEQYVKETVFQVPELEDFTDNYMNLIAVGDPNDTDNSKLKSIKIDDEYLWQLDPKFLENKVVGRNLYWSVIPLEKGAHRISSDVRFGAYAYGWGDFNSYGWLAALTLNDLEIDTVPPVITHEKIGCGLFEINVTEYSNGSLTDVPRQVDKGIKSIEPLFPYNFIFYEDPDVDLTSGQIAYNYKGLVEVDDKNDTAIVILLVSDHADNLALDTIIFDRTGFDIIMLNSDPQLSLIDFDPYEQINFPIYIDISRLRYDQLDSISMRVRYPWRNIQFADYQLGEIVENWNSNVKEVIEDDVYAYTDIQLDNDYYLNSNGLLLTLGFNSLLPHDYDLKPEIIVDTTNIEAYCLKIITESTSINVSNCLGSLRAIDIATTSYYLSEIAPNPIRKQDVDIRFNLGFKGDVSIRIYNSLGELAVQELFIGYPNGSSIISLDLSNLSNGSYHIIFESGAFRVSKKLIIIN